MADIQSVRRWINDHSVIVGAIVIAIAVLAIVWSRYRAGSPRAVAPTHCFFVDETTGEVVVEPVDALPPLPGTDGKPTLVRAVFYTLGSDDAKQLAYMEKYTEAGRADAEARAKDPSIMAPPPPLMVRGPEAGAQWVLRDSEGGMKVMNVLNQQLGKPGFRVVMPK